jgi:spore coat protein U domain-containing protein, fimbrial subunit CupE1/2/3/6
MKRLHRSALITAAAGLAIIAALLLSATQVEAATATASLTVSATVSVNCTVTTGTLAFGAYDPIAANASANLDGSGTFTVACTKGASGVTIDLGQGSNYSGGRRMVSSGNFLPYEVYSNSGRTTVWGSTSGGATVAVSPPASSAAVTYTVYGRIAAAQDAAAGTYSDTVVATVNF